MNQTLLAKFESIAVDDLNLYCDGKSVELSKKLRIHSQVKTAFMKATERALFDKWIIDQYNAVDLPAAVSLWEQDIKSKKKTSIFSERLVMQNNDDSVLFYRHGTHENELIYLCCTNDSDFIQRLIKYFGWILQDPFYLDCDVKTAKKELVKALKAGIIPVVDDVVTFSNDPEQPTTAYFDLNNLPEDKTLAWDSFLYTFETELYRELFMAWVYSIFLATNKGRQILWIYGMGRSGKSSAIRVLQNFLNSYNKNLSQSIEKIIFEDKFSISAYKNCRLAVIADNANRWLIKRDTIKNLTGQDPSSIREMHKERYNQEIYCKIMVASNYAPYVLTDVEHEISRIIYVKLDDDKIFEALDAWDYVVDGDWNAKLYEEVPAFIAKCKPFYDKHLDKDGQNFIIYPEMIKDLAAGLPDIKASIDLYFEHHFTADHSAPYITTTWIADDVMRFLDGMGANKIRLVRSYLYTKIRSLKLAIEDLGIGKNQVIKGLRYTDTPTTMSNIVTSKIKELNKDKK